MSISHHSDLGQRALTEWHHVNHKGTRNTGTCKLVHGVAGHADQNIILEGLRRVSICDLENNRTGFPTVQSATVP
jgi:hypothetical protein